MNEDEYREHFEDLLREEGSTVVPPPDVPEEEMSEQDKAQYRLHLLTTALTRYKGLVFEPDETEQPPENLDKKVDDIMAIIARRREKDINGVEAEETPDPPSTGESKSGDSGDKGKIILFSRWQRVITAAAAAAVLIVVFWLAYFTPDEPPRPPAPREKVAYMLDIRGEVSILRPDAEEMALGPDAGSVVLYSDDDVFLTEGSGAIITAFEDVYFLSEAGTYRIQPRRLVRTDKEPYSEIRPVISAREETTPDHMVEETLLAYAPTELLNDVTPTVLRDVRPEVYILSPAGMMYSDQPVFRWSEPGLAEDTEPEYEITVMSIDHNEAVVTVKTSRPEFRWEDTGMEPLERGGEYQLYIKRGGRLLGGSNGFFRIMERENADKLGTVLDTIETALPEGRAGLFIKANIFMSDRWRCFSEAREKAAELVEKHPENLIYLRLLQHSYNKLRMPEAVEAVQRRITITDTIETDD